MKPMSTETQPSEHAMETAASISSYLMVGMHHSTKEGRAEIAHQIQEHAIAPAVAEANKLAEARIDARDEQWSDLWAALNAQGIEAVVDGKLIYEAGKDPVAERDRRIAELVEALRECCDHFEELDSISWQPDSDFRRHSYTGVAERVRAILAKHGGAHG